MLQGSPALVTRHTLREALSDKKEAEPEDPKKPFDNVYILLAEDNKINQKVAKLMLERLGAHVTVADNGAIAVEKVSGVRPDLVLMDVQMPEMDGFQATAEIRQIEAEQKLDRLPIMALTANAMTGDRERCIGAGMDDYLTKPLREKDMVPVVSKWIESKDEDPFEARLNASP